MSSRGPQRPSASSGAGAGSSTSSHAAFAAVDSMVSKQVHGSDNTASWQSFQNESKSSRSRGAMSTGAAPILPVKRADRLGTGMQSRDDEKRHENQIRREAGQAPVGSGYTAFKRKVDQEAVASAKRAKLIADRVRPDDVRYFIAAETFGGWKEDYVFTTKDRGTGYYWDGMDSLKKQLGLTSGGPSSGMGTEDQAKTEDVSANDDSNALPEDTGPTKKKRKKKKKSKSRDCADGAAHLEDDSNNPMDQIAAAIQRRNQAMMYPPGSVGRAAAAAAASGVADVGAAAADAIGLTGSGLPSQVNALVAKGWDEAVDPSSGKKYYFNRSTGETKWENPLLEKKEKSTEEVAKSSEGDEALPDGWAATKDASTDKTYYYHAASGKTQWTKPES